MDKDLRNRFIEQARAVRQTFGDGEDLHADQAGLSPSVRQMLRESMERHEALTALYNELDRVGVGLILKHWSGNQWALVLPDASEPGKFRYQAFSLHGWITHHTCTLWTKSYQTPSAPVFVWWHLQIPSIGLHLRSSGRKGASAWSSSRGTIAARSATGKCWISSKTSTPSTHPLLECHQLAFRFAGFQSWSQQKPRYLHRCGVFFSWLIYQISSCRT
ncbi:hypothetical protein ACQ1XD_005900 [Pseudomonas aeruginosa]|nr:hypothetical protein [Pseudomonas aeruginosa]EKV8096413.1 hypothetical protein [Pseudomonas aeruginosa]EKW6729815.1 hypothetical protein [Pseudomonas aeruginosa]ELD6232328.1 hypothetical protein [Pseudomonas aeruginosa]ELK3536500.1 hypothetical protein [Pseudomonas aeruginosa]